VAGVAPDDQMNGIDESVVGRMWSSADLFASNERRGRACLGGAWPDFDSAALSPGATPARACRSGQWVSGSPPYLWSPPTVTTTIYSSPWSEWAHPAEARSAETRESASVACVIASSASSQVGRSFKLIGFEEPAT
jgi:hypothetical protein